MQFAIRSGTQLQHIAHTSISSKQQQPIRQFVAGHGLRHLLHGRLPHDLRVLPPLRQIGRGQSRPLRLPLLVGEPPLVDEFNVSIWAEEAIQEHVRREATDDERDVSGDAGDLDCGVLYTDADGAEDWAAGAVAPGAK